MKRGPGTSHSAVERVRGRIRSEGVEAACEALIAVCRDPKSPAPAKATAGVALLRAAGIFENTKDASEKEPHEMTAAEMQAEIRKGEAFLRGLRNSTEGEDSEGDEDLFG